MNLISDHLSQNQLAETSRPKDVVSDSFKDNIKPISPLSVAYVIEMNNGIPKVTTVPYGPPEPRVWLAPEEKKLSVSMTLEGDSTTNAYYQPLNNYSTLSQKIDQQIQANKPRSNPNLDQTKKPAKIKDESLKYKYDDITRTLSCGDIYYELKRTKTHDFASHCFKTMSTNRKQNVWFYSDLLENFDHEITLNKKSNKDCKNSFDHLKRVMPKELTDMFKIGSKYIQLNNKYK